VDPDVILKRFDSPDEIREFELGRFEVVTIGGMTIGRATYQPGWKWSEHVGKPIGQSIAWAGPFVMNTRSEVLQAYEDFQKGSFGHIPGQ